MKIQIQKYSRVLQYLLAGAFVILCALHFLSDRPTWLDENIVLKSVKNFSYARIFGVLAYEQIYPRVHLVIVKFLAELFDFHTYAIRLTAFLSMMGALWVWARIYKKEVRVVDGIVMCLLAFVCSYRLVYYAAELKPYATDVLCVGLYVLYILRLQNIHSRAIQLWEYGVVCLLPFLNLFGYATIFIFWILPFNLILMALYDRRYWRLALTSCVATALSLGVMYVTDLQFMLNNSSTKSRNWESYFVCSESIGCFFSTFGEGAKRLVTYWFGNHKIFVQFSVIFIPFAWFAAFKYGIQSLWRERGKALTLDALGLVLLAELFFFGLFHKYPFTGERITLYLAPFMFYFIYRGIAAIKDRRIKTFFMCYYIAFCVVCLFNTLFAQISLY